MKVKHTRWGILGLGKIARKFCLGLQHVEGAEIYAVASRSQEKADFFAKEHHAKKAYGSYEEMIKDENVDVIYVATPHVFHFKQTLLCLRNKKPVLCEKPFAMNKAEVEQMIATAKKEKVFLMEAMWTQFLPHFEYVYKLVQSGV
ncbi:MAG: Gfo/Idh/MocA family oxidoreductase, partial [Salegentibacter sp.]